MSSPKDLYLSFVIGHFVVIQLSAGVRPSVGVTTVAILFASASLVAPRPPPTLSYEPDEPTMTTYPAASRIAKVAAVLALLSAPTVLLTPSCFEVAPPPAPASGIFAQDVSCHAIVPAGATIRPPAPSDHRQRRQGNHSHATLPPVNVASDGGSISHPPTSNCRRPPTVAVAAEDEERPSKRAKVNIAGLVDPPAIRNAISDLLEAAATIPVDPRFDLESGKTLEDMSIRPEGKEIVYVAALDLPYMFLPSLRMAGILIGGNLEVADTCVRLGAAKIGRSGSWALGCILPGNYQ